jgi:ADP-heptose:LPS heptosyltransferase
MIDLPATSAPATRKPPLFMRVTRTLRRYKEEALRGVYGRSGPWARLARYPIPLLAPWRSREVHLLRIGKAIGDVLLCTPALRELKARNPRCRVHFYTQLPSLVQGLPYIDEVHLATEAPAKNVTLQYGNAIPTHVHLARVMGDEVGLEVSDVTPDCVVDTLLVERYRNAWRDLPRPHVLIVRRASEWTPNKNWQDDSWVSLADSLSQFGTVIEVGAAETTPSPAGSYLDLRGRTTLEELIAAVAAADIYVGPISGPMHIAAAVKTPAIVIVGGYEHPVGAQYKGQTYLYTPVPCSPCWLREPCPYDRKCLAAISPLAVERLVRENWATEATLAAEAEPKTLHF